MMGVMMNKSNFKPLYFLIIFSSKIGGGFFFFIVTWFVARALDNPYTTTYNLVASIIPTILLSKTIGRLCDKYNSVSVCFISDLCRVLILIAILVLAFYEKMSPINIFSICLFFYTMSESQQIGWRVMISRHFDGSKLLSLNTISVIGGQSGVIIGAACAGIIAHYSNLYVIITTLLLYSLSALFTFFVLRFFPVSMEWRAKLNVMRYGEEARLKSVFAMEKRPLLLYAVMLMNVLVLYALNSTLSPFVKFHLGLGPVAFSIIDASYSLGAVLGGWLVSVLFRRSYGVSVVNISFIVIFCSLMAYGLSAGTVVPSLCYFLIGAAAQNSIVLLTLAQSNTSKNRQGEVYSIFNSATGWVGLVVYMLSYFVIQYKIYGFFFMGLSVLVAFFWMITRGFLGNEIYRFDDRPALED